MRTVASTLMCLTAAAGAAMGQATENQPVTAAEMREKWVLDGEGTLDVVGKHELKVTSTGQVTLWRPTVYTGPVTLTFDGMAPEPKAKLLVMAYGHGSDDVPIRAWKRPQAAYDDYNAGRMEVYTIAWNRGPHISDRPGDRLANARRIGGPSFAIYTAENFRTHRADGGAFWNRWNVASLLGAALEPTSGPGKYHTYQVSLAPPFIRLSVDGKAFAELVDHRPKPLAKGAMGFRCMSRGKAFFIRNVVIEGREAAPERSTR